MKVITFMLNRKFIVLGMAFVLGVAWLVALRFIFIVPEAVHYHASFAVVIDGEREPFDGFGFYEEVQACTAEEAQNPRGRIHLHQPNSDVVHVHDEAATWGNLFENLGLILSDELIKTPKGLFIDGQRGQLSFMLNGQIINSAANRVVGDTDRLLISFGTINTLESEFAQTSSNAAEFNANVDPAGCGGSASPSLLDRLKHALFE
ncbi:MAG TPA: hypothetical protein VGA08_03335 [Candidatus Saccharimonadales bacterium]